MRYSAEERYATLAVADRDRLVGLAEEILGAVEDVQLLSVPGPATMLVELTQPVRRQPFHLCEVVVSEASVSLVGYRGDALVLGADTERAVAAAVCDAAAEADIHRAAVEHLIAETAAGLAAARVEPEVRG
jgi:alpha-D-ribose 1-methylphosphonate 5-triphosphate synthase subunit PhnG